MKGRSSPLAKGDAILLPDGVPLKGSASQALATGEVGANTEGPPAEGGRPLVWEELPLLPRSSERERLLKTSASSWSVLKGLRGGVGSLQR